jgi:hypothetical protein
MDDATLAPTSRATVRYVVLADATVKAGMDKAAAKVGTLKAGTTIDVVTSICENAEGFQVVQTITPPPGATRGGWIKLVTSKGKMLLEPRSEWTAANEAAIEEATGRGKGPGGREELSVAESLLISVKPPGWELWWAARDGNLEDVVLRLDSDAPIEWTNDEVGGGTALHTASVNGHREIVDTLLSRGAAVDARTDYRWTPLHWAALGGHSAVCSALLSAGADPAAQDKDGETALDKAEQNQANDWEGCVALLPARPMQVAPDEAPEMSTADSMVVKYMVLADATVRTGPDKAAVKVGTLRAGDTIDVVTSICENAEGQQVVQTSTPPAGATRGGWIKLVTSKGKVLLEPMAEWTAANQAALDEWTASNPRQSLHD